MFPYYSVYFFNHQPWARTPKAIRKDYFIIFEEGEVYLYQGCMRSQKTKNIRMVVCEGRNYNIRFGCVTQFASMIDKDIMKFMNQRIFGASNEPNDLKYLRRFLGEDVEKMKSLTNGQFVYYCRNKTTLTEIEPFQSQTKSKSLQIPEMYSVEKLELNETPTVSQPIKLNNFVLVLQVTAFFIFLLALLISLGA